MFIKSITPCGGTIFTEKCEVKAGLRIVFLISAILLALTSALIIFLGLTSALLGGIDNTKRYILFRVAEKNYVQNFYTPTNPQKYIGDLTNIVYRSSYELRSFRWCDSNPSILEWSSESIIIKYFDPTTQKIRRYFASMW
jgi:hypothetical protein